MPRHRRARLRVAIAVLNALMILVAWGFPVYVQPRIGEPHRADAIVVLGGPGSARYTYGLSLADRGLAPTLLVSDPGPSANDVATQTCTARRTFTVSCFTPNPATTRGEAREIRDRARANGWHDIIVVTFRPHISRARYIIQRCYSGQITMMASPEHIGAFSWVWSYLYQSAGYLRASVQSGC